MQELEQQWCVHESKDSAATTVPGGLKDVGLPLDPHVLEGIRLTVPIIKEELFTSLNCPLGKDSNPMISIHHDHFSIAVGVHRMVCKSNFVSFPGCIHYKIIVEVEEEAGHVFVIDFPSSISLILRDKLTTIFRNEFVLLHRLLNEGAPSGHIRGGQQQVLLEATLDATVLAGDHLAVPVL